jgi:hypothetical protein
MKYKLSPNYGIFNCMTDDDWITCKCTSKEKPWISIIKSLLYERYSSNPIYPNAPPNMLDDFVDTISSNDFTWYCLSDDDYQVGDEFYGKVKINESYSISIIMSALNDDYIIENITINIHFDESTYVTLLRIYNKNIPRTLDKICEKCLNVIPNNNNQSSKYKYHVD